MPCRETTMLIRKKRDCCANCSFIGKHRNYSLRSNRVIPAATGTIHQRSKRRTIDRSEMRHFFYRFPDERTFSVLWEKKYDIKIARKIDVPCACSDNHAGGSSRATASPLLASSDFNSTSTAHYPSKRLR